MTLALISGRDLIESIIFLIIAGVICGVLLWLIGVCKVPDPFAWVLRVVLYIAAAVICINFLLSLIGHPFIAW